jgi:DNA gyrase subunit A
MSVVGRNTQGVRLIRLEEGDLLSGLERIDGLARDEDAVSADDPPSADTDETPNAPPSPPSP